MNLFANIWQDPLLCRSARRKVFTYSEQHNIDTHKHGQMFVHKAGLKPAIFLYQQYNVHTWLACELETHP
jgi:hypothetical protein